MDLKAKFQFIYDNIFLIASCNNPKEKQELFILKKNLVSENIEAREKIYIRNPAIFEINIQNHRALKNDQKDQRKMFEDTMNAISNENIKTIDIPVEIKFQIFKTWVQGMAEEGIEAFLLQNYTKEYAKLLYPIFKKLVSFIIKNTPDFLPIFWEKIEKECIHDGKLDVPSFVQMIQLLQEAIRYKKEIRGIYFRKILKLYPEYLFKCEDNFIRRQFAEDPDFVKHKFYKKLYKDHEWGVRRSVAANKEAALTYPELHKTLYSCYKGSKKEDIIALSTASQCEEFKFFFSDNNIKIRKLIAQKKEATNFQEYKILIGDKESEVRKVVAHNIDAVKFPEYAKLFDDHNWEVRRIVKSNPEAKRKFNSLHSQLIPNNFGKTTKEMLSHNEAPNYGEYHLLFNLQNNKLNPLLASNPNIFDLDFFRGFFSESDLSIYNALVRNPSATQFPEFIQFFKSKNRQIRRGLAENPLSSKFKEYTQLFNESDWYIRKTLAQQESATQFEEYKLLFSDYEWIIRQAVAYNNLSPKFEEYKTLFTDTNQNVKIAIASNLNACEFKEEFSCLFAEKNISILRNIAANSNAVQFEEYKELFENEDEILLKKIAQNQSAVRLTEYKTLFNSFFKSVKNKIARNPKAVNLPEFKSLFNENNWEIQKSLAENPEVYKIYQNYLKHNLAYLYGNDLLKIAENQEATKNIGYKKLFFINDIKILLKIAANPGAPRFEEYKSLFNHEDFYLRREVAKNLEAKRFFPNEYKKLIPPECGTTVMSIIRNNESTKFAEYKEFFKAKYEEIWYFVEDNPGAAKFDEYRILFTQED